MKADGAETAADNGFRNIGLGFLLLLLLPALSTANPTLVVTDTTWKAVDSVPDQDAWIRPKYDDSKWGTAKDYGMNEEKWKHFTVDNIFGFASDANWIWTESNKGGYLRKNFKAPEGFHTAEMVFVADDVAEVWINDDPVDFYDTKVGYWGYRGCAVIVDVMPWVKDGNNLVAVKLKDNGGERGFAAEIRLDGEPLAAPLVKALKDEDLQKAGGTDLSRFHDLSAAQLKEQLNLDYKHQQVTVRLLVAAARLAEKDPKGLEKVLRSVEEGGNAQLTERIVRYIGALSLKSMEGTVVEVLKMRAGTREGAFAAAALARVGEGDEEAITVLEKALHCDYAATERAAKRALATLRK